MSEDEQGAEKQKIIDDLYHKVWSLVDELSSLKSSILEVGEEMKKVVSKEVFK